MCTRSRSRRNKPATPEAEAAVAALLAASADPAS